MKRGLQAVFYTFFSRKFLTFCLLGCINTFDASLISYLASFIMQENIAANVGYLGSLVIAFFLSCRFIFKKSPTLKAMIRFFISYIPNYIIFNLVSAISINAWHWQPEWGTALAIMVGGPITFVIIKIYAFGTPHPFHLHRSESKTDTDSEDKNNFKGE